MTDASSALEMLKQFLAGPEAKEKIAQALDIMGGEDFDPNMFSAANSTSESKAPLSEDFLSDIDPKKMLAVMSALKKCQAAPDPRTDLLRALKPYLGNQKSTRADKVIKIAALLKYAPLIENIKDLL